MIGGEAGQGLVTIGELLSKSLVRSGYDVSVAQSYQSRIRGGHNTFSIRIADGVAVGPSEKVDLLVALNKESVELHQRDLQENASVICDASFGVTSSNGIFVPYSELSSAKTANVAALGVLAALLGLDIKVVAEAVHDRFGKKHAETVAENESVLQKSFDWGKNNATDNHRLEPKKLSSKRMMINGNEAIALGAISAGLKFAAFYPMTPATSVNQTLINHAHQAGIVVEQVEDEIAAINMALGAAYAGGISMVATSGGGFALMVEGVSLAGMTEVPIVCVVAQRPGPATGLPTRTEQADLEFVLYSGHGEFPRVIYAPADPAECFYLTRLAFAMAESYQIPSFILTDQYLADSFRSVEPFPAEKMSQVEPQATLPVSVTYERYALTSNGISPRLFPGQSNHLVVSGSDEHTPDGHLTEDLEIRKEMMHKRWKKFPAIVAEVLPPRFVGEKDCDLLLVSWGSTFGAVNEAAEILREQGVATSVLHFSQVWPLVPEHFAGHFQSAGKVIAVEGNYTGQLAALICRESGFSVDGVVTRYDGLPITADYILRELK